MIANIIINFLVISIIYFNTNKFLTPKKNLSRYIRVITILMIIIFIVIISIISKYEIVFYILCYFIPIIFIYEDSIYKKTFYSVFFYIIYCLVVYFVLFVLLTFIDIGMLNRLEILFLSIILMIIMSVLIQFIILKLFQKKFVNLVIKEKKCGIYWWLILSILAILLIISFYIQYRGLEENMYIPRIIIVLIFFTIALLVVCYLFIIYYFYKEKLLRKNKNQSIEIKLLNDNLNERKKLNEEKLKIIHDIKKHNLIIKSLIKEKKFDQLLTYINNFNDVIDNTMSKDFTQNLILNNILKINVKQAINKEINMNVNCEVSKEIKMDLVDLTTLFGNLIENAIEANDRIKEKNKFINIDIWQNKNILFFSIINSNERIETKKTLKEILKTKKNESENHGIGIKNIKKIVNKYEGTIIFEYENNIFKVKGYLNT